MDTRSTEIPIYQGHLFVQQSGSSQGWMIGLVVGCGAIFAMATMVLGTSLFGTTPADVPGFGVITLSIVMSLVGAAIPLYIRERLSPGKYFSGNSQVCIDENGIEITGLGTATWGNVLSYEGIPDSDSSILIHTINLGTLLITDAAAHMSDQVLPALHAYLHGEKSADCVSGAEEMFRVIPFHWRRFQLQIATGYVIGGGAGVAGAIYGSTFLKSFVALIFFPPVLAYLVWMIPFGGLSFGSTEKVTALTIKKRRLVSMDGEINVDLTNVAVSQRRASGIGYTFEIVTLTIKGNAKIYFIPHDNTWGKFVSSLQATVE